MIKPSELPVPDQSMFSSPVVFDTETTGLHPDDGATVSVVSIAFRDAAGDVQSYAWAFDHGRVFEKGLTPKRWADKGRYKGAVKGSHAGAVYYGAWPDEEDWQDPNLPTSEFDAIQEWLAQAGQAVGLIGHNVQFDCHVMTRGLRDELFDAPAGRQRYPALMEYVVADTMLSHYVLYPTNATHALKPVSVELRGESVAESSEMLTGALAVGRLRYGLPAKDKRYDLVPNEVILPYAEDDARMTLWLYEHMAILPAHPSERGEIENQLAMAKTLFNIEIRGLGPLDKDYAESIGTLLQERMTEIARLLYPEIEPPTPAKAKAYFFDKERVQDVDGLIWGPGEQPRERDPLTGKISKQGALSTITCAAIARNPNVAPDVQERARLYGEHITLQASSRYYVAWPLLASSFDGKLRARFRQAYVNTGRLSVERVQLQAVPRHLGLSIRDVQAPEPKALLAPEEGRARAVFDLQQAELRIAASFAECRSMLDLLNDGADVHGTTATRIFGETPESAGDRWSELRTNGKRVVFSSTFGVGPARFQSMVYDDTGGETIIPLAECRNMIDAYIDAYPEYSIAYEQWMDYALANGRVPLVRGRQGWFNDREKGRNPYGWWRSGWSRRVQGSLAVFVTDWVAGIEKRLTQTGLGELTGTVHDSIYVDHDPSDVGELEALVVADTVDLWNSYFGGGKYGVIGGVDYTNWGN